MIWDFDDEDIECVTNEDIECLRRGLDELTAKQRFVVEMSWGIRGERPHSFREIAELMGVNYRAVWQHYWAGAAKLKKTSSVSP